MNAIVVIDVGVEGGGVTVMGREVAGQWEYWQRGDSIDLDDETGWRGWESKPTSDLFSLLPERWHLWYPIAVHPNFKARIRAEYDRVAEPAESDDTSFRHHRHAQWLVALS